MPWASAADQFVRRLRVVVPTAALWSLLLLGNPADCLHAQRGMLWPWLGSYAGIGWPYYAWAIGVTLAILAHPIRPHWTTAFISFVGVSIWYCAGIGDAMNTQRV